MTARKIEIADELWAKVRIRAFETGTTATALVTKALEALLAGPQTKASVSSDGAPRSARPPKTQAEAQELFDAVKTGIESGDFVLEHDAAGQKIVTPLEDPWKELSKPKALIQTPEEAARVAATIQPIHPVPKPTSRATRSKRRSGSPTAGTDQ